MRVFFGLLFALFIVFPHVAFSQEHDPRIEEAYQALREQYPDAPESVLRDIPIIILEEDGTGVPGSTGAFAEPAGNVQCFDYYHFGSVSVEPNSEIKEVVAGSSVPISLIVRNNNAYPIVDGTVWVKIFRKESGPIQRLANGDHVVDYIPVVRDITLSGGEAEGYSFFWDVPVDAINGEYYVATFFTTSDKYNMLGLSFTDDIVGETYFFSVSDGAGSLYFDKRSVRINENPYQFIGAPPATHGERPIPVAINVVNPLAQGKSVTVSWKVYAWDALQEENLLEQSSETLVVPPESAVTSSHIVRATDASVYLIVAEVVSDDGSKSIANMRFVRTGIDIPRINFPSTFSYPIVGGEEQEIFACLHNSGFSSQIENGELELSVTDRFGRTIHQHTYSGAITGSMMGVATSFTSLFDHKTFSVKAALKVNGEVVEEETIEYRCQELDGTACHSDALVGTVPLGTLFVLIVVFFFYFAKGIVRNKKVV